MELPHLAQFVISGSYFVRVPRNVWVWIHQTLLAEGEGKTMRLHLERLRFKRMLDWIDKWIVTQLHDGSMLCVE